MKKDSFAASTCRVIAAVLAIIVALGIIGLIRQSRMKYFVTAPHYKGYFDRNRIEKSGFDWQAHENLIAARTEENMGFLKPDGSVGIPFEFSYVSNFREGLSRAFGKEGIGFIDPSGKWAIGPLAADNTVVLGEFSEGLVKYGKKTGSREVPGMGELPIYSYGFMDKTGTVVIEPIYESVGNFSEGKTAVKVDEKWGEIDSQGNVVTPPTLDRKP